MPRPQLWCHGLGCLLGLQLCGRVAALALSAVQPVAELQDVSALVQISERGKRSADGARHGDRRTRRRGDRDLAMVHIPVNWGHTMEVAGLRTNPFSGTSWVGKAKELQLPSKNTMMSFQTKTPAKQWKFLRKAMGEGGEAWGMMNPDLRPILPSTGCDMYYSPPKYWPEKVAAAYLGNKTVFGMLRDPYDRMANVFRNQVQGVSSLYKWTTRLDISRREGNMEREGPTYQKFYKTCDVNGWLKSELAKYKAGDHFRADCILMPQAEFFDMPHGVTLPIDNRRIPDSFNELMEAHGYDIRMGSATIHNFKCDEVTAWSFDKESVALIKEVYARDFDLICKHFGYCDRDEKTCLHQIPQMCGKEAKEGYSGDAAGIGGAPGKKG